MSAGKKEEGTVFSALPICILKDSYCEKRRESFVHFNDVIKPNRRILLKAIQNVMKPEKTFTPYHYHEGVEILRINEGSVTVLINNVSYEAKKDDILIVNPFEPHGIFSQDINASFTRTCIMFHPQNIFPVEYHSDGFFSTVKSLRFQNYISNHAASGELCECIDTIVDLYHSQKSWWSLAAFSKLIDFYKIIAQNSLYNVMPSENAYMYDFMTRVSDYVENNLDQDISTSQIAATCQYSTEHFCRLFKKCFGTTFKDYLNIYRIQRAKNHIDRGKFTTLAEVSSRYGFNNQNHFSHMFKKYIGLLPSEYIHRNKNTSQSDTAIDKSIDL